VDVIGTQITQEVGINADVNGAGITRKVRMSAVKNLSGDKKWNAD